MTAELLTTERPYLFQNGDEPSRALRRLSGTVAEHEWTIQASTDDAFSYDTWVLLSTRDGKQLSPVWVEIRESSSYISVSDKGSGIYGVGESVSAAIEDFRAALIEYRDVLARRDDLSPGLRRLLAQLAALV
jgi:hypothetical protein